MGLQGSGEISLLDIANQFGGSSPHEIAEYYRNGGLVPSSFNVGAPLNDAIPTSGTISFNQFYYTTKYNWSNSQLGDNYRYDFNGGLIPFQYYTGPTVYPLGRQVFDGFINVSSSGSQAVIVELYKNGSLYASYSRTPIGSLSFSITMSFNGSESFYVRSYVGTESQGENYVSINTTYFWVTGAGLSNLIQPLYYNGAYTVQD